MILNNKYVSTVLCRLIFVISPVFVATQPLHESSGNVSSPVTYAHSVLGCPYVAGTLDTYPTEQLIYHHDRFDCVTLIDWALAHVLSTDQRYCTKFSFEDILRKIRYESGITDGYASRMHYFSSWIENNIANGYIREVTQESGGEAYRKTINYMSSNKSVYPALSHKREMSRIKEIEKKLSSTVFYHIPGKRIKDVKHHLRDGDIIAFTTHKKGLDISHTGFIIKKGESAYLLHASYLEKKVVISDVTLDKFVSANPSISGIRICRVNE
jgi:hypothetical protein